MFPWKFPILILFTFICKCIEVSRSIANEKNGSYKPEIQVMYGLLYLHLPMSMAAIGLCWEIFKLPKVEQDTMFYVFLVFILTIAGCFLRGTISKNNPESMTFGDLDWLFGIYIPNSLGFISLILAVFFITG